MNALDFDNKREKWKAGNRKEFKNNNTEFVGEGRNANNRCVMGGYKTKQKGINSKLTSLSNENFGTSNRKETTKQYS